MSDEAHKLSCDCGWHGMSYETRFGEGRCPDCGEYPPLACDEHGCTRQAEVDDGERVTCFWHAEDE